jgi:replicative DNA helicase
VPFDGGRPAPPHNLQAEESVIGGVLVHARKLSDIAPLVSPDDFYHPALRAIYEAMIELESEGSPVDALTVTVKMRALETFDKLRAFNGEDYLTDLQSKVVTVENLAYHARIVRAKAARRRWVDTYRELAARGLGESDDDEFFADAEQRMLDLALQRQARDGGPKRIWDVMSAYQTLLSERVVRRQQSGSGITGVPTGYKALDDLTSGWQPGDLIIIAARPAMGKSAFVMNGVVNAARIRDEKRRHKHPALVFELEMSDTQMAERMVSGESRIDSQRLRQGDVQPRHWEAIGRAVANLAELPVHIDERVDMTLSEMRSVARSWRMSLPEYAEPQVIVDYLQLIRGTEKKGEGREREIAAISRGLKAMAKELKCPVIALSQLNRSLESRTDKRPMLSDLRESGAIEQDSDVVAFIYRDDKYHTVEPGQCKDCGPGIAEIIVEKQRMGPCATAHLAFVDAYTRFENLSQRGGDT